MPQEQLAHSALHELDHILGRELPLDSFHGAVRRAAQAIRPVVERGTCLVTCSDEFQCEVRSSFDRDVARPLMSNLIVGARRTFTVANMGGRVEPGALALAGTHFTVRSRTEGAKLLLVVIAAHVGRMTAEGELRFGELDRFGVRSPCCGALTLLLDPPPAAETVRHPWFDQLTAFFGPERLAALRADTSPTRMVVTAIVHAVLQAESALADLLREPPPTPTEVLLVPLVVVNQPGVDGALLAGWHHLRSDGNETRIVAGASLRSTPSALAIDVSDGRVRVTSEADASSTAPPPRPAVAASHRTVAQRSIASPEALEHFERVRAQTASVRSHPGTWRVYARPILRALLQRLSMHAPEAGLAAMLMHVVRSPETAAALERLLASNPSGAEARKALHDLEAEIQQLGHREAQQALDHLLAHTP